MNSTNRQYSGVLVGKVFDKESGEPRLAIYLTDIGTVYLGEAAAEEVLQQLELVSDHIWGTK